MKSVGYIEVLFSRKSKWNHVEEGIIQGSYWTQKFFITQKVTLNLTQNLTLTLNVALNL